MWVGWSTVLKVAKRFSNIRRQESSSSVIKRALFTMGEAGVSMLQRDLNPDW